MNNLTRDDLIFDISRSGRRAYAQAPAEAASLEIPESMLRTDRPQLPEASELQTVRHFTRLSQKNFSIATQFYPLGSCTMKYNPRACNALALLPEFAGRHPLGPTSHGPRSSHGSQTPQRASAPGSERASSTQPVPVGSERTMPAQPSSRSSFVLPVVDA